MFKNQSKEFLIGVPLSYRVPFPKLRKEKGW